MFLFSNLRITLSCVFLISIAHWVYPAIWGFWSKEVFGWTSGMIGLSLACYGVGITVVQGFVIRMKFVSNLGAPRVVVLSLLVGSFSLFALGFSFAGWVVFLLIPFSAMSELLTPTLNGYMSNKVSDLQQGELQGVIAGLSAITSIISPILMTVTFNFFSRPDSIVYLPGAPFLFASILCLITILPLWKTMNSKENLV